MIVGHRDRLRRQDSSRDCSSQLEGDCYGNGMNVRWLMGWMVGDGVLLVDELAVWHSVQCVVHIHSGPQ